MYKREEELRKLFQARGTRCNLQPSGKTSSGPSMRLCLSCDMNMPCLFWQSQSLSLGMASSSDEGSVVASGLGGEKTLFCKRTGTISLVAKASGHRLQHSFGIVLFGRPWAVGSARWSDVGVHTSRRKTTGIGFANEQEPYLLLQGINLNAASSLASSCSNASANTLGHILNRG